MRGALAYYTCDAGHRLAVGEHGRSATPLRVCLENGRWNGTTPKCVPLEGIYMIAKMCRAKKQIVVPKKVHCLNRLVLLTCR